jgi:hypothetical protein
VGVAARHRARCGGPAGTGRSAPVGPSSAR